MLSKFSRYHANTINSEKFIKFIGYGCAVTADVIETINKDYSSNSTLLRRIASNITMSRYVLRFGGLLEAYEAFENDSWVYPDDCKRIKMITRFQALSMILYYPLEYASWIGYVAPELVSYNPDKYSRQSCLMWTLYILFDLYASMLRIEKINQLEEQIHHNPNLMKEEIQSRLAALRYRKNEIRWNICRSLLYLPTAVHWSMKRRILPEPVVQLLGLMEAIVGGWQAWKNCSSCVESPK